MEISYRKGIPVICGMMSHARVAGRHTVRWLSMAMAGEYFSDYLLIASRSGKSIANGGLPLSPPLRVYPRGCSALAEWSIVRWVFGKFALKRAAVQTEQPCRLGDISATVRENALDVFPFDPSQRGDRGGRG